LQLSHSWLWGFDGGQWHEVVVAASFTVFVKGGDFQENQSQSSGLLIGSEFEIPTL
jgi:hypothetical protein